LYNGLISGVSLDGKTFFYPNPLESMGNYARSPWFGVACCPGNMTRFLASVPGYVYAQQNDSLYVNLFVASRAEVVMPTGRVTLTQETRYPWDGVVKLSLAPEKPAAFEVKVRIPGWARNTPMPSDLYRFSDIDTEPVVLKVNGQAERIHLEKGYATLRRTWKKGDVITLALPMPARRVLANDLVTADKGRVALQRGPIVYAAEGIDNAEGKVRDLLLPASSTLRATFKPDLLNGVEIVEAKALALSYDAQGKVNKREENLVAVPYYAWANRGKGQMIVWLPTSEASAKPLPYPTLATTAAVTASGRRDPHAVNDGEEPVSSADMASHFDWWPKKSSTEWIQYTFAKTASVSQTQVYWFDDAGGGECRVPASWRLLYKSGEEWKPVENLSPYGMAKDGYNTVTFKPVATDGIRLEVTMQDKWSAGVEEWKVK
jgi:hypothetical protein